MSFEPDERPAPFTTTPYLRVALPKGVAPSVPVNASGLIREWELMIDPVRALKRAMRTFLMDSWTGGGHFVEPSFLTAELLRRAATDEAVATAFHRSNKTVEMDNWASPIADLVSDEATGNEPALSDEAAPVLLGLAVASHFFVPVVGVNGEKLFDQWDEIEKRRETLRKEYDDAQMRELRKEMDRALETGDH